MASGRPEFTRRPSDKIFRRLPSSRQKNASLINTVEGPTGEEGGGGGGCGTANDIKGCVSIPGR